MTITTTIHPEDLEFRDSKLKNYRRFTDFKNIQVGDHFRLTQSKYQEDGRKCGYIVVQSIADDMIYVNRYSPTGQHQYPDWCLRLDCPFRKIRLYKKG